MSYTLMIRKPRSNQASFAYMSTEEKEAFFPGVMLGDSPSTQQCLDFLRARETSPSITRTITNLINGEVRALLLDQAVVEMPA